MSISQFGYREQTSTFDAILKSTKQKRLEHNKKKNITGVFFRSFKGFCFCKPQNTVTEIWKSKFDDLATNLKEKYLREETQRLLLIGI